MVCAFRKYQRYVAAFFSPSLLVCVLCQAPGLLILRLAVPVVDEDKYNNNWCRPLNSLHCILAPTVGIILASDSGE